MFDAQLIRFRSSDHGTFGMLTSSEYHSYTIELPWRDNAPNVSCIPTGEYDVIWCWSNHFKRYLYLLDGVPGRSGVRIHAGNLAGDITRGLRTHSQGCILPGTRTGIYKGQRAVILSEPKVSELQRAFQEKPFRLSVVEAYGII